MKKTVSKALVLVDVEEIFKKGFSSFARGNIKDVVQYFIDNKWPVIMLKYDDDDKIMSFVRNRLKKYNNKKVLVKTEDDGSGEVIKYLKGLDLEVETLVVLGCRTDKCVLSTTIGLAESNADMRVCVLQDACWGRTAREHNDGLILLDAHTGIYPNIDLAETISFLEEGDDLFSF